MIVDFHIHYPPEQLVRPKLGPGGTPRTIFVNGAPAQMPQQQIFALENHIVAMDEAGVDVTVLSSPSGLVDDLDQCRMVNDNVTGSLSKDSLTKSKSFLFHNIRLTGCWAKTENDS